MSAAVCSFLFRTETFSLGLNPALGCADKDKCQVTEALGCTLCSLSSKGLVGSRGSLGVISGAEGVH